MRQAYLVCALALWGATCATPRQAGNAPGPSSSAVAARPSPPTCKLAKPVPRMWLEFGDKTLDRFEEKTQASHLIQQALNDYVCVLAGRADPQALAPAERSLYDATHPDVPARIKSIFLKDLTLAEATALLLGECQEAPSPASANPECARAWEVSLAREGESFRVLEIHAASPQRPRQLGMPP